MAEFHAEFHAFALHALKYLFFFYISLYSFHMKTSPYCHFLIFHYLWLIELPLKPKWNNNINNSNHIKNSYFLIFQRKTSKMIFWYETSKNGHRGWFFPKYYFTTRIALLFFRSVLFISQKCLFVFENVPFIFQKSLLFI